MFYNTFLMTSLTSTQYGEQKRIMFHGKRFMDKIEASPVCASLGFPEAGHWVMHVAPEKMANAIEKFLASHSS